MLKVPVFILLDDPEFLPTYGTPLSSGADAKARVVGPVTLLPGDSAVIPIGIRVEIPEGYELQIRPRSGFASKNQVTVLNTPGTIDADYRGEICVILINHGKAPFIVVPKMKIAQLVLSPVVQAEYMQGEALSTTQRGEGGFGHTGA
jgi:dUTP pyrophosphatase